MSRVTLEEPAAGKLMNLRGSVEVFSATGLRLGISSPEPKNSEIEEALRHCPYSSEELRQSLEEAKADPHQGQPLKEIWKEFKAKGIIPQELR